MARKHGFRGTPVRPSSRLSSSAGIFEKRGDPMVSPREGLQNYGRNLETENPDYDRFFARVAHDQLKPPILKPSQVDKGNAFRSRVGNDNYDAQRVATNIVLSMRGNMRKAEGKVIEHTPLTATERGLISCPYNCGLTSKDSRKISEHLRNEGRHADCRLSPEERERKRRRERNG